MTEREYYTKVLAIKDIPEEMKTATQERLAKLDAKNEKRKTTPTRIQKENEPIAQAILAELAKGEMLGIDLATAIGQSTSKTNGVALNLVKEGKITSTKVKIKGKGERVQYALMVTEVTEDAEIPEDTTEDIDEDIDEVSEG